MRTILKHLYKKNTLHEIEVETLQQLTQRHPSFAIGQYLLAKKLTEVSDSNFKNQFQKALVYFHNPLWLQYQLSAEEATADIINGHENEQTVIEAADPAGEISASPHDLIEEVLLHQEISYGTPEEMLDLQTKATEQTLADTPSHESSPHVKEEAHAVNQPERFSFQAYHTVDYFASQGIKLSQDVQSNDKLGKQLKSFTEWLKTMRRLPESVAEEVLDKINDVEIVQFAADSLEEKEVVTETMAEVLVKQEKFGKAREVYGKLSLLHPQKSAYFAAKIEDLKQQ